MSIRLVAVVVTLCPSCISRYRRRFPSPTPYPQESHHAPFIIECIGGRRGGRFRFSRMFEFTHESAERGVVEGLSFGGCE